MLRYDRCLTLLMVGILGAAAPDPVSAGASVVAIGPAGGASAPSPADTTTPVVVEAVPSFVPIGTSVTEAAWGAGGDPAVLHVVAAGVEHEPVPGLTLRVEMLAKWGHDGVSFPSSQGLSSLDADDFGGLGEAWVEWRGAAGLRVKAGRVDGNAEFAAAESAALFANPSFGLSPALGLLPSYPAPAPSVNVFVRPVREGAELGAGVYRAADGVWSVVGQVAGAADQPVRWVAGVAAPLRSGPIGTAPPAAGYLIVEGGPVDGVAAFGKLAAAGELLHLAGGVTVPFPVAATRVGLAGSLVSDPGHPYGEELVAEAYVAVRPVPWLVVQPDLQLRLAPGASPRAGALLRLSIER